jgi:hypothetical protein
MVPQWWARRLPCQIQRAVFNKRILQRMKGRSPLRNCLQATIRLANGGRTSAINWLVDGARNVDTGSNLTLLTTPSIDAIQEFTILTSNYAPEFGRNGGDVINVVTRSGSNDFHGTLYEFVRNDALNARPTFQLTPLAGINKLNGQPRFKAPLRYNDYGFTIGGPLYLPRFGEGGRSLYDGRNKTFFFYSQEWKKTSSVNTAVWNSSHDCATQRHLRRNNQGSDYRGQFPERRGQFDNPGLAF